MNEELALVRRHFGVSGCLESGEGGVYGLKYEGEEGDGVTVPRNERKGIKKGRREEKEGREEKRGVKD